MKENTRKTLKIYFAHAAKYKLMGVSLVWAVISAVVLGRLVPIYYKNFIDAFTVGSPTTTVVNTLFGILTTIGLLLLGQLLFWRIATFLASQFVARVMADLATTCFAYLHKHSYAFFNDNFVGSLVKRVNYFVRAFDTIFDRIIWDLLQLVVSTTVILAVLSARDWRLGVILLIWIVIFLTINLLLTKYKLKFDIAKSAADTTATGILADTITNNITIKLFTGYQREKKYYTSAINNLKVLRIKTWNLDTLFDAIQNLMTIMLEVGIMYFAIRLWMQGRLTPGDVILLQFYVYSVFDKVWDFGKVIRGIYENLADAEEMTQILTTPHEVTDVVNAKPLRVTEGKIEFVDVLFNYRETRSVFKDFNLVIPGHQKLALVGPSGAGKTTIVKILLRLYDLTDGQILIDGQDIFRVTQESLWAAVSLVPQDPILFHRTLMENIRYGKPDASNREVMQAAKLAHCHEFISEFPEGYDTYVGERGVKLSGGERQRVAIARAILRNAPILVLDEATSSLDSESEKFIQDALATLMAGKTVIVIAHRLSTIMKMDRIVVIKRGKVIEGGTHTELLEKPHGVYKKLWELQAGGFIQ